MKCWTADPWPGIFLDREVMEPGAHVGVVQTRSAAGGGGGGGGGAGVAGVMVVVAVDAGAGAVAVSAAAVAPDSVEVCRNDLCAARRWSCGSSCAAALH